MTTTVKFCPTSMCKWSSVYREEKVEINVIDDHNGVNILSYIDVDNATVELRFEDRFRHRYRLRYDNGSGI